MKRFLASGAFAAALVSSFGAQAADLPVKAPPPIPPIYSWTGFYGGVNVGAAWGAYDPITSTPVTGTAFFSTAGYLAPPQVAAVNAAGQQRISPTGFVGGEQFGYNWQTGSFVLGVEADFDYLHLNGSANSAFIPYGLFLINPPNPPLALGATVSSYAHSDWLVTLRPRIGFTQNNWLFYATGGLALTQFHNDFVFADNFGALQSAKTDTTKAGWTVGAGFEWALSNQLSVKAEYLYVNFTRATAGETANNATAVGSPLPFNQSSKLTADLARVGLNYHFNAPGSPFNAMAADLPVKALPVRVVAPTTWEFDVGSRLWFSTGSIGAPQPLLNSPPTILASRLTYKDENAWSGETFARADHDSGVFVKGFLGAGGITSGKMYDEDFPAAFVYSNTLQSNNNGHLAYANADLGYTFIKSPGAKIGAFIGYNYYQQHVNTYGCTQLAGDQICLPGDVQPGFLIIAEDDHFNSLRLGLTSEFMLTDRLKFTSEVAYLPSVNFKGQDDHNARQLLLPEAAGSGNGVMLEAILGYRVTDNWNVGLGGRYWAWNMRTGTENFDFLAGGPVFVEPARFTTERYGFFLQTDYHWGDTTAVATSALPVKAPIAAAPMSWTGFYIGGHLGGAASNDHWSDPFGSTSAFFFVPGVGVVGPFTNVAGFGDKTHATGPLAGGQIGVNWQTGQWVLGLEGSGSWADIRGENSCFTGIGGVNCQRVVNALGTVTGRVGYAWNRTLVYAKAGGAWVNTTYNILGNTGALALGAGSTSLTEGGWTAGLGLEYAVTNNWTTSFEYDHIGIGSATVPFPTVAVLNTQSISVKQSIELFKLGVNYKLPWAL